MLEFQTVDHWDEQIWEWAGAIYHQAFDAKGAKPDKVLRNMFKKGIGTLHLGVENQIVVAVAITGAINGKKYILIDYLAVATAYRNKGTGRKLIDHIKEWSNKKGFETIIIEVEAEKNPENSARITFWEKCGFTLTEYIHQYIWVPEPYQAMYYHLQPKAAANGNELFSFIRQIHKQSFQ